MSQDNITSTTVPLDAILATRDSPANAARDSSKLLFDEAIAISMDMELSDDPKAWEILTQNLYHKHGVSRSISANEDHMNEMISI